MNEGAEASELTSEEAIERANQLREAANSSAGLVRNLFLTFLLLGTYIAVTIGSTTDLQLLRISPVTLPIIDVDLPIVAFYAVVPWLLVLFHFNLLLQLYLLARQLHLFNAAVAAIDDEGERTAQRARLFPFPLVHMLAGASDVHVTRVLFGLIVWVTIVWVPLALIISAQVRFLPYHDSIVIGWNRLAVLLDLFLLWTFWPLIVSGDLRPVASWWSRAVRGPKRWISHATALYRRFRHGEDRSAKASLWESRARGSATLLLTSLVAFCFSFVVAVVPGEPIEGWVAAILPAPGSDQEMGRQPAGNLLTHLVFDGPRAPLHRNLQLAEQILLAQVVGPEVRDRIVADRDERSEALANLSGIDLSGRDLRYANLHRAVLPHADLRGANLDGADLRRTDLRLADLRPLEIEASGGCVDEMQRKSLERRALKLSDGQYVAEVPSVCLTTLRGGARLNEAWLSGAAMNLAVLDGADLRDATLDRAKLPGASLTGARLEKASASEANLRSASLAEADLTRTTLDRADMRRVDLSGATLNQTALRGAKVSVTGSADLTIEEPDLTEGSFQRADLRGARIKKGAFASFSGSDLRGADLSGGSFRGAVFRGSDLRGADLSGAKLDGADFEGADLRDAKLSQAQLNLAKFIRLSACRANFSGARLRGAHFENVALLGASLNGAILDLAALIQVDARALDARDARLIGTDIYNLRVDYGDLRNLVGDVTQGLRLPKLLEIARELRSKDRLPTRRQGEALDAADSGVPPRESPRSDATFTRAPLLCDETAATLIGANGKHCMTEDALTEYVDLATSAACGDRTLARGLVHRLVRPDPPLVDRSGKVVGLPPAEAYTRLLAAGLTKEGCQALETLDTGARLLLSEILERSDIATPGSLADAGPATPLQPDGPPCGPH